MSVFPLIVIVAMTLAVAFYVAGPLWRRGFEPGEAPEEGGAIAGLLARRDAAYGTLKEIELDFQAGKLLEEDYRALLGHHRAEAVAILQQLDEARAGLDARIEQDVAKLRQRPS